VGGQQGRGTTSMESPYKDHGQRKCTVLQFMMGCEKELVIIGCSN
jgi:hypothetical protein